KFVDKTLSPPVGAWLGLPGTTASDAQALASRMSWLIVDRAFDARSSPARYRPVLTVRYPEGAPRGVPLTVSARFSAPSPTPTTSPPTAMTDVFDVRAGAVPMTAAGAADFVVSLPPIDPWKETATLESIVAGRTVKSTFIARQE